MNDDLKELLSKLVGYTIGVLVANGIIMWVYNMVVPDVFGFKPIGYWQLFIKYLNDEDLQDPRGLADVWLC